MTENVLGNVDLALPVQRHRFSEPGLPFDRIGIIDCEPRGHRTERIEVDGEEDLFLRQKHHQRGVEWFRPV